MALIKRYFKAPKRSYFLFGPRGTGKSTWVKGHYQNALCFDLLLADVRRGFEANPEQLHQKVEANPGIDTVIIDEIQKVPELLTEVHALIEEKRGIQFVLTGSSARKLKQAGVDLLGGRASKRSMHPFMASEIPEVFSLEKALAIGMLPLVWDSDDVEDVIESYINLYIDEEVKFEGLVQNFGSFARFVKLIAFSHGSILNVSNMARECEVKRPTVQNYVQILEDMMIAHTLPVFTKRAKRELVSHPKFYLFDSGVYRYLRSIGPFDRREEIDGMALEGLVHQHIRAWCDYTKGRYEIFYWRTRSGLEVDFVIFGTEGFWAIEVKNGAKVSSLDVRGLLHLIEDYPECQPVLLYRGKEKLMVKGVLCLPVEKFLTELTPHNPIFSLPKNN